MYWVYQLSWCFRGFVWKEIIHPNLVLQVVGELDQKDADQVAKLMAHQPSTQHAYYVAAQDTRDKIRACQLLASVLCKVQ